MCDEIAIINHGEVVVQDSTKNLLGSMDAKTLLIEPDGGVPESFDVPDGVTLERKKNGTLAFSYARNTTSANDILDAVKLAGITIGDVRTVEPDLEDVFVELTSGR
jgi:ABC-2 type transport system ATP-binding protein